MEYKAKMFQYSDILFEYKVARYIRMQQKRSIYIMKALNY